MNDVARQMRETHEAAERELQAARRRAKFVTRFWMVFVGAMFLFDAYVWGPSFIRAIVAATAEWRALF